MSLPRFIGIRFESELDLRYVRGADREDQWELLAPLVVSWTYGDYLPFAKRIEVPAGFRTDLASIPRPLRSIVPVVGRQTAPAVVHDYLYENVIGPRRLADRWFRAAMAAEAVGLIRRLVTWAAVRLGGWLPWRRYQASGPT